MLVDEKNDVDHVEKAYDSPSPRERDLHPEQDWTHEEEQAIVKKADWRVFPMLCIVFGLSLLDRTNISAAYIAGLARDLQLTGQRYNIALLVFFIGYCLFELPSNYVIRRLGARIWLSVLIVAWGACVLGMGFVHSWEVLTVLRAFLGVFEAGLFPGAVYIIGSWYRQFETAKRVSVFYMAALLASGFGPIFAYALSLISVGDGMYSQGWRWIFIIEGIVTIVAGFIAPFFLVEFPEKVGFLTDRQKQIAITRVSMEKSGKQTENATAKEMFRMIRDWKLLVYSLQYFVAASSVYSLAFFQPIILRQGMGFSYAKAQLLSSPPYIFTVFASLATSWLSDRIRMRWPILVGQSLIAIVGLLLVLYPKPPAVRYFGLFLATWGTQGNIPASLAYGNNQTARVQKRAVVAAVMISVGAAGGVTGSTIFQAKDAPRYMPGMWATISMQLVYSVATLCMSMYFKRQNKLADETGKTLEGVEGFRYAP
ncbi:major facilitator superfamily domain-containing protein [Boeremia exigua]|uniref:major facilitator superfamily domain-containing protein n=1 Tax=Boeremia exigua TaxID=749465 RepID=UPI001E8D9E8B|nr:major facilitator superfamily domain-containing protein [Boeremia exigua]KAH6614012.1 major facilitator superfamily domain-containing protein [Boeremia exigua]